MLSCNKETYGIHDAAYKTDIGLFSYQNFLPCEHRRITYVAFKMLCIESEKNIHFFTLVSFQDLHLHWLINFQLLWKLIMYWLVRSMMEIDFVGQMNLNPVGCAKLWAMHGSVKSVLTGNINMHYSEHVLNYFFNSEQNEKNDWCLINYVHYIKKE